MKLNSVAAAAVVAAFAAPASAALIDFTDASVWVDGSSTATVGGALVSLSAIGGPITQNFAGAPGPIGGLLGQTDGLGIGDDEVNGNRGESITVTFSSPVMVISLLALDLFAATNGSNTERMIATFSGGEVIEISGTSATGVGFGFESAVFAPITTTSITFTAAGRDDNNGDFALAGIEIAELSTIPLPSSALLFGAALAGFAVLRRRAAI